MCFDYDGYSEVWNETTPRARKPYRCCECGGTIAKGEQYRNVFSVYEGDAMTSRTCLACERVREIIQRAEEDAGCSGNETICPIGELRDAIRDAYDGYGLFDRGWYALPKRDVDFVQPEAAHLFPYAQLAICF